MLGQRRDVLVHSGGNQGVVLGVGVFLDVVEIP